MIRHVVLLKFKPGADPEMLARFKKGVYEVPDEIPGVREYSCGSNVGTSAEGLAAESDFSDNFDFAVVADLDDYEAYRTYASHQAHKVFIEEVVRHVLAERVAVQYDLGEYATKVLS
jgi:hypothetical protein